MPAVVCSLKYLLWQLLLFLEYQDVGQSLFQFRPIQSESLLFLPACRCDRYIQYYRRANNELSLPFYKDVLRF